ncbi:MAG: methyl-accepting chemotaxis protein [Ktedonobacteraceae bacterium]
MNPDRNSGGMTVNSLMLWGLGFSAGIPVVLIAILGVIASRQLQGNDATNFVLWVFACAIAILIGVLIVNYIVQRKIKDRFLALVEVCRNYSSGDRTERAPVNGDDEFAMLTMTLNALLDNPGVAQGGVSFAPGGNDAAALQAQIEKLLQEVSAVGDGDLRVQAEVTPDTLGVLADSFNYMIEELAKVVGRVQTTAVQVTNATRRILDRSAELAQASETQVAQISQTTEAVEALAVFIQNVARNAQLSAEVAQEALRNASSGQQSVRQTIEGMLVIRENVQETSKKIKRLGERSNEIGEIVRIIEDIADQTNLLALNAAIQSAMAGEHGRGFAVVADEIRLLAERSTESTKRIATLVKSIQGDTYEAVVAMEDSTQEVVKGSQLADEAGRSLNSIYSAVERQAQMIESIARAANEQTSVSEAVAVAMGQISEITRQTNIGTQEAAGSVSYLAELSDQLRASVSTFRLPDRVSEGADAFAPMTAVTEFPGGNDNQFFTPALAAGSDGDWSRNFSGNFPPLPEPGGSGSLVALTARSGSFNYNNQGFEQQSFAGQPGVGNHQGFGGQQQSFVSQPGFAGQQSLGNVPGFDNGQQAFGNAPSFNNRPQSFSNAQDFNGQGQGFGPQYQPEFTGQPSFEGQGGFGNQQAFASQPGYGDYGSFEQQQRFGEQQQYDGMSGAGNQSQPGFPFSGQGPNSQSSGLLQQQQGQNQASRQQWQRGPQQHQSQFSQDQAPFPNNGQFSQ